MKYCDYILLEKLNIALLKGGQNSGKWIRRSLKDWSWLKKCTHCVTFKSGEFVLIYLQDTGEEKKCSCTNRKGSENESEVTETKQV